MHPRLPRRAAALILTPVLAGTAGVAGASSWQEPPAPTASMLPGTGSALGDLRRAAAATERREAAALREQAEPDGAASAQRFPVAGSVDFGEAAARFGNNRGSHVHEGQDIFAPAGTAVRAVSDAVVVEAGGGDARGNHVALYDRRRNRTYVYFHLQAPATVKSGERVRAGRRIGRVGCTGRCFGDHLHFEVHVGRGAAGRALDPWDLLVRTRRGAAQRA